MPFLSPNSDNSNNTLRDNRCFKMCKRSNIKFQNSHISVQTVISQKKPSLTIIFKSKFSNRYVITVISKLTKSLEFSGVNFLIQQQQYKVKKC